MTLLLDTHTVLWLTDQVPKLGRAARRSCDAALAAGELAIPTVVIFEIGWGLRRGTHRRTGGRSSLAQSHPVVGRCA